MSRRKLTYAQGSLFSVRLTDGSEALGVVARLNGSGIVLAYFFLGSPAAESLRADQADLCAMVGDLGLLEGGWTVKGPLPGFTPAAWPVPRFRMFDPLRKRYAARTYGEDLSMQKGEEVLSEEEALTLPKAGVLGDIAALQALEALKCAKKPTKPAAQPKRRAA